MDDDLEESYAQYKKRKNILTKRRDKVGLENDEDLLLEGDYSGKKQNRGAEGEEHEEADAEADAEEEDEEKERKAGKSLNPLVSRAIVQQASGMD